MTSLRAAVVGGVLAALSLPAIPGTQAAVTRTAASPVRGLDVSAYQHTKAPIDWALLARQGIRFAAVKASEGTYYVNPYYLSDTRGAAAAGLQVFAYVFANPSRAGGAATARFAVTAAGNRIVSGRAPLVVDLENDPYKKHTDCYGLRVPAMRAWIGGFIARAEALTGTWPIIYTTTAWWQECTRSTGQFRRDPLWLASFGVAAPAVPSPWRDWTFWQYDNLGVLPGIGQTDLDYYQPTRDFPALLSRSDPDPARPPASKVRGKNTAAHRGARRHPVARRAGTGVRAGRAVRVGTAKREGTAKRASAPAGANQAKAESDGPPANPALAGDRPTGSARTGDPSVSASYPGPPR